MSTAAPALVPLLLSVKPARAWRGNDPQAGEADREFSAVREDVLIAQGYRCQGCGFESRPAGKRPSGYMEVHHLNHDHTDNRRQNLAAFCPICHRVFHLGYAGIRGSGFIIYCPWLTQAQINNLCITLFKAADSGGIHEEAAMDLYTELSQLYVPIVKAVKGYEGGAAELGNALMQLSQGAVDHVDSVLKDWRLLPLPQDHTEAIQFWARQVYSTLAEESWAELTEDIMG